MTDGLIDLVDPVTDDTLGRIRALGSPVVSIHLPTHRDLPDPRHDSLQLRSLVEEAAELLAARGLGEQCERILAPGQELVGDRSFWARQADGLALFLSASGYAAVRLPVSPVRRVHVGDHPDLTTLVQVLSGDAEYVRAGFGDEPRTAVRRGARLDP